MTLHRCCTEGSSALSCLLYNLFFILEKIDLAKKAQHQRRVLEILTFSSRVPITCVPCAYPLYIVITSVCAMYGTYKGGGKNVVEEFREACGPADPEVARVLYPETIRALLGVQQASKFSVLDMCRPSATKKYHKTTIPNNCSLPNLYRIKYHIITP